MNPALWSAVGFLFRRTVANRTRVLLRRLREPRYALGAIGFGAWIALVAFPRPLAGHPTELTEAAFLAMVAFPIAVAWLSGTDDVVIAFTEAEIHHLFPAPATRRQLLAYKIARGAIATLAPVALLTLLIGVQVAPSPLRFVLGAWVGLVTLDLHLAGASIVRSALAEWGLSGSRRQLGVLAALAAAIGALTWWSGEITADVPHAGWLARTVAALETPPVSIALAPARAPLRMALAPDAAAFLASCPLALGSLGLHAAWVLSAGGFEEGSVQAAARVAALRQGRPRLGALRRMAALRLPLPAVGPPWTALAWKGVLCSVREAPLRLGIVAGASVVAFAVAGAGPSGHLAGPIAALFLACYLATLGTSMLRADLRQDLAMIDVLRAFPLSGRAILVGELLGPAIVLWTGEAACLVAALSLSGASSLPPSERLAGALALGVELGVATVVGLVVQNGAVILFPGIDAPGLDTAGRRLLTMLANAVIVIVAGVPTAIAALAVPIVQPWLGLLSWPLAALVGVGPILGLVALALDHLGRRVEALDPAEAIP